MSADDSNFSVNEHVRSDVAGEDPVADTAAEVRATGVPDRFQRRQQRIEEQMRESLEHEDTRTSILGAEMADLMQLQLQLGEALREALGDGRVDPSDLARNREGIDMLQKLTKGVMQLTQVHRKLLQDAEQPPPESENQSEKTTT